MKTSYAHILRVSTITGGASGANILLGMMRVKLSAILLGAFGIGLITGYTSLITVASSFFGLGIQSSAVRELSIAIENGSSINVSRIILSIRRISFLAGIFGLCVLIVSSSLFSKITFGNNNHSIEIAALGIVVFIGNITIEKMVVLQCYGRIGDLARVNILTGILGTISALIFYVIFGLRGIIPALLINSVLQLVFSVYFSRRIRVEKIVLSWAQTFTESNAIIKYGLIIMWNGIIGGAVTYITIMLARNLYGIQAVGIYSAAFALSGMVVSFILNAMSVDYYPRLSRAIQNKEGINQMVNEQTEISLILSLPGLVAIMGLAPWVLRIFYSNEFGGAALMLQIFIFGCVGRIISWPLGYVLLVLGDAKSYLYIETFFNILHICLIAFGLHVFGLKGIAIAFVSVYLIYYLFLNWTCKKISDFKCSDTTLRLLCIGLFVLLISMALSFVLPNLFSLILDFILTVLVSIICLHELSLKLGKKYLIEKIYKYIRW